MGRKLISGLCLALLLAAIMPNIAPQAYSLENYTLKAPDVNTTSYKVVKPSEIIALYPMLPEDEENIVHEIPGCPVIIDGTLYKPEGIALFNGQRLHFTVSEAGYLHAFTKAREMESFLEDEYGPVFDLALNSDVSELFEDWLHMGNFLGCPAGQQFPQLSLLGWDNCISSAKISHGAPVTLWDYAWFGGDSFTMAPGSSHLVLTLEGWNDRASSIS